MSRIALNVLVLLAAISTGVYQFYIKDFLVILGHNRVVESIGNKDCQKVPELRACEKIILHQPTGHLYLACSEPDRRIKWLPAAGYLNVSGSGQDYLAVYNPSTSKVTKLKFSNFDDSRGFSSHGMDIVPSASNPSELFIYLVNHRPPPSGLDATLVGADSVVEIFKTTLGSDTVTHIKTVESPLVKTPNDVIGSDDGQSFFVTNDHGEKLGHSRLMEVLFKQSRTSVVYCHLTNGCKYAIQKMHANNGIARASNGTIYVANAVMGGVTVLEQQTDNTLVITDHIKTDRGMDNLSIDSEGHVWAAAFSKILTLIMEHFKDPTLPSPSSALRFSINTGPNAFYGEKYKVDKVFEDDGSIASGITSVAYDTERKRLFLHGINAPHLTICNI